MKYVLPFLMMTFLAGCGMAEEPKPQAATPLKVGDKAPAIASSNWLNATACPKRKMLIVEFFSPDKEERDRHAMLKIRWFNICKEANFDKTMVGYVAITSASLHDMTEQSTYRSFPNYPVAFNKKTYADFGAKDGSAFIVVDDKIVWAGTEDDVEKSAIDIMNNLKTAQEKKK